MNLLSNAWDDLSCAHALKVLRVEVDEYKIGAASEEAWDELKETCDGRLLGVVGMLLVPHRGRSPRRRSP